VAGDSGAIAVSVRDLRRVYGRGDGEGVAALNGLTLEVRRGEFLAVMGPSGCGKSTLLNLIGGLDRPTGGAIVVDGEEISRLNADRLARYRRERVGIIFQSFNLLPRYTVLENAAMPLVFAGVPRRERERRAAEILERLGMSPRSKHRPPELSGGELQRAAIARALIHRPTLLLADEPTGNLDSANGAAVAALLRELHGQGQTIMLVTHDAEMAGNAQRVVRMRDGVLVA
jgi:putative ABC transport system ATP-binding protein